MTWEYIDTPSYLLKARKTMCAEMEQLFNGQKQNNGIHSFRYFHLFEITLHRKKEYDEHSLITNYSHSHITSQHEFSLPTA